MEDFQEEALGAQSVLSVFSHDGVPRGVGVQRGRRLEGGALGAAEVVRPGLHVRVRRRAAPGAGRALVRPLQLLCRWEVVRSSEKYVSFRSHVERNAYILNVRISFGEL